MRDHGLKKVIVNSVEIIVREHDVEIWGTITNYQLSRLIVTTL